MADRNHLAAEGHCDCAKNDGPPPQAHHHATELLDAFNFDSMRRSGTSHMSATNT
jgi:hypothetical protein